MAYLTEFERREIRHLAERRGSRRPWQMNGKFEPNQSRARAETLLDIARAVDKQSPRGFDFVGFFTALWYNFQSPETPLPPIDTRIWEYMSHNHSKGSAASFSQRAPEYHAPHVSYRQIAGIRSQDAHFLATFHPDYGKPSSVTKQDYPAQVGNEALTHVGGLVHDALVENNRLQLNLPTIQKVFTRKK